MEIDRQRELKRRILVLRMLVLAVVLPLAAFLAVYKTVYPHNHDQGPIALVTVAIALGVALPVSRRIHHIQAELASRS